MAVLPALLLVLVAGGLAPLAAQHMGEQQMKRKPRAGRTMDGNAQTMKGRAEMMRRMVEMAPARGYLEAHGGVAPQPLFGGPLQVRVSQTAGGVFVALPDERELDPRVFGTPDMPRAYAGTPGISGLPPMARGSEDGTYTKITMKSPFGDAYMTMAEGRLDMEVVDATAMDASSTSDRVRFTASWKDREGNEYEVACCGKVIARGLEFPTFGGVVTNHLLHGFTRLGTPLMPTEYVYAAFWGMGTVKKNGEVVDRMRLVHGMLTEYVRAEGYTLARDDEVTPTRMQFHLMVPPFQPNPAEGRFEQKPVKTGLGLPNGMELPFWHVMFENLTVNAERISGDR